MVRTDDHGHLVDPELVAVLVASTLTQTLRVQARLKKLAVQENLVRPAFVEKDGDVSPSLEGAESREHPVRAALAGHLECLGYPEDGHTFGGFALQAVSTECQYRTSRPHSVVL